MTSEDMRLIARKMYIAESIAPRAKQLFSGPLSDALRNHEDAVVDGVRKALRFVEENKEAFLRDNLCF